MNINVKKQKGAALVEAALIMGVIGLVGFAILAAVKNSKKNDDSGSDGGNDSPPDDG